MGKQQFCPILEAMNSKLSLTKEDPSQNASMETTLRKIM